MNAKEKFEWIKTRVHTFAEEHKEECPDIEFSESSQDNYNSLSLEGFGEDDRLCISQFGTQLSFVLNGVSLSIPSRQFKKFSIEIGLLSINDMTLGIER